MFRSSTFKAFALGGALLCVGGLGACATTRAATDNSLSGTYDVAGRPPGGGAPYAGEVVVEKTGATYKVTWFPGTESQANGIGILRGHEFSVGYLQNGVQGVAVYEASGKALKGVWASYGDMQIAPEDWTRRSN